MLRTKHFKTALASTSYYDNMIIIFHVKLLMLAKFVSLIYKCIYKVNSDYFHPCSLYRVNMEKVIFQTYLPNPIL